MVVRAFGCRDCAELRFWHRGAAPELCPKHRGRQDCTDCVETNSTNEPQDSFSSCGRH